ncbi:MAG: hypothetical protein KA132_01255 [Thauera sp.]|nr:hypothetical protein [Thauera sp.]MBP7468103.1 hypothetical protein [Thauera sp.]
MQKHIKFIAPAALAVAIGGYFGLGAYASSKAEKQLEDWVYDNGLSGQVSWRAVSSTPLGGTVTIDGLAIRSENPLVGKLDIAIDRVAISDYEDSKDRKRVTLDLTGIQMPTGQKSAVDALKPLLHASGRNELQPFDLHVKADYKDKERERSLGLEYKATLPDLLATEASFELSSLPDPTELANAAAMAGNPFGGGMLGALGALESIEIGKTSASVRDLGYFARRGLIEQRYKYPVDPLKGDPDKQRKAASEADIAQQLRGCEQELASMLSAPKDACAAWVGLVNGTGEGARISIAPERPMRVAEFARVIGAPQQVGPMLKRLQLKVNAL